MDKRLSKKGTYSQKASISRAGFTAITAVEGLRLSAEGQKRVFKASTTDHRRALLYLHLP
ncbi:MAG: hypothetical protein WBX25_08155 [Rhodomicrobium sp.]